LAGKYRVERVLGQGGMGVVLEATQLDLERRVALKFLRTAVLPEKGAALTRFEREARTVARLRGAHIVQVYDVGRLAEGEPFIVMELLSGEDLSAMLDRERRLPVATAVDFVLQACEAMAEAHVAGVIHRDLKPANLFVSKTTDGRPLLKVLDFGISKLLSETTSLNLTSGALGSPLYMSPEQLGSAKDIDHRTDVWSLGAILYELLSGTPAFDAAGLPQVCARIMLGAADPIRKHRPEVPQEIEQTIIQCLRRYPDERLLSVADLAAALLPFARKGALTAAEATIRIVQASSLPHGPLPRVFDSVAPPQLEATYESPTLASDKTVFSGPPSSVVRGGAPTSVERARPPASVERTVNVSGAPPGPTQAELKPLVSPARGHETLADSAAAAGPVVWGVLGLLAAGAILVGVLLARHTEGSAAAASAEPTSATPAPTPQSQVTPPELAPASSSRVGAPATAVAAAPQALPKPATVPARPAAGKPRPKPAGHSEPSPEELLNHR
jgi:serine/threonine protein kinase